ncbi:helix-turn-helix transcriptional regulator [Bacillus dakarensis]|uniref:helix-turn-helix transcriptional regulator n=1 Tax=Robertmurraya dakarensis TaxID=1926278 RepID=UPI0009822597|nr:metalloregulator ArsR/SmtB family transcription factor [Bacillus dakarensis]
MTMKMTTKDKILDLLKKEVSLAVNDLTQRLNITHMAVRKHLDSLQKDHLVQASELKQAMGRPLQIYSLTEKAEKSFPKNYEGITLEFLYDIKDLYGDDAVEKLFNKREERLTKEYSQRIAHKTNVEKINELVTIQNEKGYMADVSLIDEDVYELVEHNCPILAVANTFKTACQCETQMLQNVLHTDNVRRVSCKTDGDNHCKFIINFKQKTLLGTS